MIRLDVGVGQKNPTTQKAYDSATLIGSHRNVGSPNSSGCMQNAQPYEETTQ